LDPTGQGFIRRDVFFEALTSYGDQMSKDQLSDILRLNNQDFQSDPYFDYRWLMQAFYLSLEALEMLKNIEQIVKKHEDNHQMSPRATSVNYFD